MKSVPNLMSYLQKFSWNFSQFLAICFELFSSGANFYFRKSLTRGTQLSAAASRAGPACQRAVSAWLPRVRATLHALRTADCRCSKPRPAVCSQLRVSQRATPPLPTGRSYRLRAGVPRRSPPSRACLSIVPTADTTGKRRAAASLPLRA
jgi:hypothetical protein